MDFSVKCRILVLILHLVAAFRDPCSQSAFTCLNLAIETLDQGVKYVQS